MRASATRRGSEGRTGLRPWLFSWYRGHRLRSLLFPGQAANPKNRSRGAAGGMCVQSGSKTPLGDAPCRSAAGDLSAAGRGVRGSRCSLVMNGLSSFP